MKHIIKVFLVCGLFHGVYLSAQNAPCLSSQSFHIVVLGSSTAAGTGPSSSDSAWVNRYRAYLKSINPANDVTNLALGGTTTYHIMPTGFVPAISGRPLSDTMRNVTKALSLNPDAIIINMPSNDISRGYAKAEQLYNFDSLVSIANLAGVPVWVCTTQPRNGLNATQTQWQADVKDSILLRFGSYAINFWDTFATPANTLEAAYNSGDGLHMNDAGHALLFERVKNKNILTSLFQTLPSADFAVYKITPVDFTVCGDSNQLWQVIVTNNGASDASAVFVELEQKHLPTNSTQLYKDTISNGLNTCQTDTIYINSILYEAGTYRAEASLNTPVSDPDKSNDTLFKQVNIMGHPGIFAFNDTVCTDSIAHLIALTDVGDSLYWYEQQTGGPIFNSGNNWTTTALTNSITYYVQSVRGPQHFYDSVVTTYSSNNNWNGIMFNLVAKNTIVIDSLALKSFSTGKQVVEVYSKAGSYIGFENTSSAWTISAIDTINVINQHDIAFTDAGNIVINTGDTLGIYIKMQHHTGKMAYLQVPNAVSRSNTELEIITGSAISHNWSASYFPRDWNGTVYYHFGNNPLGTCHSKRTAIEANMELPDPKLGADTIIVLNESLQLTAGNYSHYNWSTGDTSSSILLKGNDLGIGNHVIYVDVISKFGCTGSDTITVTVNLPTGIQQHDNSSVGLFVAPNPNSGQFILRSNQPFGGKTLTISNVTGQIVFSKSFSNDNGSKQLKIDLSHLRNGHYNITLSGQKTIAYRKLFINR